MKCKQTVELFDSYLNGTATPAEKQALENHLKSCEACQKQLEVYRFYISDVTIEDDFCVPPQLNVNIKYRIQQARVAKEAQNAKKIPFWQNKRILSAATACAFLLVAGIFGLSHYDKLQDAGAAPVIELTKPLTKTEPTNSKAIQNQADIPAPTPVLAKESRQIAPTTEISQTADAQAAQLNIVMDTSQELCAYPKEVYTDTTEGTPADATEEILADATEEILADATEEAAMGAALTKRSIAMEDVFVSAEWKDAILSQYPHEVIGEDTFLVTVTKSELEHILGYPIEADETKTQLMIRFEVIAEE